MKYNPLRWVCQTRPERCDGRFYANGRLHDCPLAGKCHDTTSRRTPYEYMHPHRVSDPQRYLEHAKRSCELRRVFLTGADAPDHAYYQKNKDRIAAYDRERYRRKQEQYGVDSHVGAALPCGGDCEQCPYDDECRYQSDDDVSITVKRRGPTPKISEQRLREMVADGMTVPQMSRLTGASQKSLRKRCAYFNLKPALARAKPENEGKKVT